MPSSNWLSKRLSKRLSKGLPNLHFDAAFTVFYDFGFALFPAKTCKLIPYPEAKQPKNRIRFTGFDLRYRPQTELPVDFGL